jgi:hypothetical protein
MAAILLCAEQGRKTYGRNHSRRENKGLSAGNGPFRCTAFMRFRGPQEGRSEAPKASQEGTESRTAKCETERPARHEQLMEEVCERENCWQAYKRVKANKGSPGIDGMKVGDLSGYLKQPFQAEPRPKEVQCRKNRVLRS